MSNGGELNQTRAYGEPGDEVEVDVSTTAWKVTYSDAFPKARDVVIEGIRIPFLGLDDLIASKETYREQDAFDRARLLALRQQQG